MNNSLVATAHAVSSSSKKRFLLFITVAIVLSLILVGVAMELYNTSGAAQLDLSRPGYQSVRAQSITSDNDIKSYSGSGPINASTISEFKALYKDQAQKIIVVDAFGGDPLSPDALGLNL